MRTERTVHDRRWVILGVLVLCLLVVIIDNTILNVALKTIQEDLDASQGNMEWAVNAYVLVFAGLLFTWGVLGDRIGRRRTLLIGLAIFGVTSAICAFAGSAGQLIAFRALMGIGGAAIMPQTLSIITNVFEPAERGRAIGIWAGFSGLAIAIGPVTGGLLLEHFWWGSIFLVNVPVVVVAIIAILLVVPESSDPNPSRLDPLGVLLSIAGLVLLVYGIIRGGESNEWVSPFVLGSILLGIALIATFVLIETRSDHPSLDMSLFRRPEFSAASAAIALAFFGLMGAIFYLSFYLQAVRGYGALDAGLCFIPVAAALMIAAPRSARFVQRFGPGPVCGTGLLIVALTFASYFFVDADTPLWVVEILLFTQGLGMGNTVSPATNAIMNTIPREKAGAGSAVNNTVRQVAGALGVAILGSILSSSYRSHLGGALDALPASLRTNDAVESIGGTLESLGKAAGGVSSGQLPQQLAQALPGMQLAAQDAFVSAMHVTSLGAAGAALIGSIVAWVWLPRRPITQPAGRREEVVAVEQA